MFIPKHIKTILVAPLDWGLGHATRCIPLINQCLSEGKEVVLAADGDAYTLLNKEFPTLTIVRLKGYNVTYSNILPLWLTLFLQVPKLIMRIISEHNELKKIIAKHKIDMVISDNRYGLWNKNIHSVFVTHQLNIRASVFSPMVNSINRWFVKKYNECWVPDYAETNNLSGQLSHGLQIPTNVRYIGPLSRFTKQTTEEDIDLLCLISGPEPSRSVFEEKLIQTINEGKLKNATMVGGTFRPMKTTTKINYFSFANSVELQQLIARSKVVISRAGYSTIMDLHAMKKKMILVPTPGQTEQTYLASYLSSKPEILTLTQDELSFEAILTFLQQTETVKILV